jgi:molecular chaperone DnaK
MLVCEAHLDYYVADLDLDGIVHVTAKDKATGKDQSMTIASSSGLSDKDIEKMISESEQYAETDKARRALIEEANKADSVCSDTEKGMFSPSRRELF